MAIFMLSLAGLPPVAGFFGKFYLFSAAMRAGENYGLLWLVALALLGSFISLYYYLAAFRGYGLPFLLRGRVVFGLFLCRLFVHCFRRSFAYSPNLARLHPPRAWVAIFRISPILFNV